LFDLLRCIKKAKTVTINDAMKNKRNKKEHDDQDQVTA